MADSKLAVASPGSASPPPHCAICLGTCKNKSRANSCMHEFCYSCLLEWSRIKAECPLCKQEFKSILHNIKSINEYDVHIVDTIPVENNRFLENASLLYLPATPPIHHHYQFRTTLTVDSHGEHAIQQMLLHHPLLLGSYNPDRYHHRRRRGDTSTAFRRSVYADNLWVYAPPDITGRYRDVSPSFYRNNPAARTRLVPWLNRELNALLHENTQHVMHLVDIILDHLLRHHICSYMFRSLLHEYLSNKTDHFIHEFYNFMRSPFDMVGYDRHVIYTEHHQHSPIHFIDEVDISDYDSDVILISDGNNNQGNQNEPVVIDLVETDSDEPILVSEERFEPPCVSNVENREEEEENRKPILPLKLRIKNKHKKEKRSRGKKKRRHVSRSSSSSSSTSEDSSSTDSSSDSEYQRYKQKRLLKKEKKRRQYEERGTSENEDDVPLTNFTKRRKVRRHKKKEGQIDSSGHSSDSSFYSDRNGRNSGKSRGDDRHKAGPSSGRLKHMLKKEANQWYSRPLMYASDSSDN